MILIPGTFSNNPRRKEKVDQDVLEVSVNIMTERHGSQEYDAVSVTDSQFIQSYLEMHCREHFSLF